MVRPIVNFAFQLKHLKGVNKQAFIDNVCDVKKVEALRIVEDFGVAREVFNERRKQIYEAFTGLKFDNVWETLNRETYEKGTAEYLNNMARGLERAIDNTVSGSRKNELALAESLNRYHHYLERAKSLGIDVSDFV